MDVKRRRESFDMGISSKFHLQKMNDKNLDNVLDTASSDGVNLPCVAAAAVK